MRTYWRPRWSGTWNCGLRTRDWRRWPRSSGSARSHPECDSKMNSLRPRLTQSPSHVDLDVLHRAARVTRKFQALPDAFGLEQMPALVSHQDLQTCSDRETKPWNKGVLESDTVYVVLPCVEDQLASLAVAAEEPFENGRFDLCAGRNLFRRPGPSRAGRGLDIVANEPSAEPARRDLRNHSERTSRQRTRHRRKVHLVGDTQVLETLSDAPLVSTRLPVQLP
jgi:hypothetical protein